MTETKILMINYEYPPVGGGTAKACRKVVDNLVEKDVKIHLLTSSPSDYSKVSDEGLTVERLDVHKNRDHVWTFPEVFWFILKASYRVRKLAREKDFDFLHAWTGFPCGFVARFSGMPYIVSLRGGDVPGFDERFNLFYPFLTPLIKNIWKNSEALIPNSKGLRDLAQQTLETEMTVIPNGIDTEKFYPKESYSSGNGALRLVTVCRLTSIKRTSDIIEAIQDMENVRLDIIGTGNQEKDLKYLSEELGLESRVNFTGYVENDELPEHLNQADLFVLPSLNEGMSNAILEGMASGLPVITTDVGGSEELIDGNGFLVEKKDSAGISNVVEKYLEEPSLLEIHGKRSRELAESKDWRTISEKFYQVYLRFKA